MLVTCVALNRGEDRNGKGVVLLGDGGDGGDGDGNERRGTGGSGGVGKSRRDDGGKVWRVEVKQPVWEIELDIELELPRVGGMSGEGMERWKICPVWRSVL